MFNPVELTDDEKTLAQEVPWNVVSLLNEDLSVRTAAFERMGQLTESLLRRKAIPAVRLDYFTKPDMNIGGHGKSRADIFEKNGTKGKAIFRHAHFIPYLKYFIFGPDLPDDTIQGFRQFIYHNMVTSDMVLDQLIAFVRSEVRQKRLDRHQAADEFFKLANEVGCPDWAEALRSEAMSVRSKAR